MKPAIALALVLAATPAGAACHWDDDFDRRVAELGHDATCAQLDAHIRLIETAE